MNLKIYQSYYAEQQLNLLDPDFIPVNNQNAANPELREYPIIHKLYQENLGFDGYWGMVSWRFTEKCNITGKQYIRWIESNPGYDVYHINHCWFAAEKFTNMYTQGEKYHPGIIEYTNKLLTKLGYNFSIENVEYPLNLFMSCNFQIGNKKFWDEWINFVETSLAISKSDEWMNNYLYNSCSWHRAEHVPNFSFVVERFPSLFLYLNKDRFKVLNYPYEALVDEIFKIPNIIKKSLLLMEDTI